jgi:hypothetical protein
VRMQRADGCARRHAALLEVKQVSATSGTGFTHAAEGGGDVFCEGVVFAGGRTTFGLGQGGMETESEFKALTPSAQSSERV